MNKIVFFEKFNFKYFNWLSTFFFMIGVISAFGQGPSQAPPNFTPLPPEAANLFKYSEMPVSLSSGIQNVNIPLFNVENGSAQVPISISYHAGGVKVEEIASWVGLGWSLNAGGMISRSVRGLPDDKPIDGFMNTDKTLDAFESLACEQIEGEFFPISLRGELPRDYEPDIFYFNFMGYSGRFIFDQFHGEFVQMPESLIKIEYVTDNISPIKQWKMKTPDGYTYFFGRSEDNQRIGVQAGLSRTITHVKSAGFGPVSSSLPSSFIDTWFLMDIRTPKNENIKFEYQNNGEGALDLVTRINELEIARRHYSTVQHMSGGISGEFIQKKNEISFSSTKRTNTAIKSITYPNGRIEFNLSQNVRLDLSGTYPLKEIIQFDMYNKPIKAFVFNYDYFIGSKDSKYGFNNAEVTHRLYLKNIQQKDITSGESIPPYQFQYYTSSILPDRFSNAQDYWGYYNGQSRNQSLLPLMRRFDVDKNQWEEKGNANRTVNSTNAKSCSLSKIIYPTGGSEEFIYESNTVNQNPINPEGWLDPNVGSSFYKTYLETDIKDQTPLNIQPFSFGENIVGPIEVYSKMSDCKVSPPGVPAVSYCPYILTIVRRSDLQVVSVLNPNSEQFIDLEPNEEYIVRARVNQRNVNHNATFEINLRWKEINNETEPLIGGLRIKKIITHDSNNNVTTRDFDYSNFSDNKSSGYSLARSVFVDKNRISSNSLYSNAMINGRLVGYTNVTESINDNEIGKTEYTYSYYGTTSQNPYGNGMSLILNLNSMEGGICGYAKNSHASISNFHLPEIFEDWYRGNLLLKTFYKKESGMFQKVKEIRNNYETKGVRNMYNLGKQISIESVSINNIFDGNSAFHKYVFVNHINYMGYTEWHRLKNSEVTDFFGNNSLTNSTDYYYDEDYPLLVSRTKTISSDSKSILSKNYYAHNVNNISSLGNIPLTTEELSAIKKLQGPSVLDPNAQYRVAEVIQLSTYSDLDNDAVLVPEKLVSSLRTTYGDFGNNIILPKNILTSKGENTLESRIIYHNYDDRGNPLEVFQANGTSIVYIWGYNQQYPIAKIENASFTDIPITVYESIVAASKLDMDKTTEDILWGELSKLRDLSFCPNLSESMVTTYTYDPLIGVTSSTDPKGNTVYYEYDNFNRLKQVKDHEGNILSKNDYNYRSQN